MNMAYINACKQAVRDLLEQGVFGAYSVFDFDELEVVCQYEGSSGCRCIAGLYIHKQNPSINLKPITGSAIQVMRHLMPQIPQLARMPEEMLGQAYELMYAMQVIHDNAAKRKLESTKELSLREALAWSVLCAPQTSQAALAAQIYTEVLNEQPEAA